MGSRLSKMRRMCVKPEYCLAVNALVIHECHGHALKPAGDHRSQDVK